MGDFGDWTQVWLEGEWQSFNMFSGAAKEFSSFSYVPIGGDNKINLRVQTKSYSFS